jgi:dipeptidyl aminopeptidase/acylaminoacyl peptidase
MATASLTRHILPGSMGNILVDLRTGDRKNPRPAVVVMHGFKGFKDWGMFPLAAERLARAGMSVISFNVSGSGVDDAGDFSSPDRFGRNTYSAELADLHQAIDTVARGTDLELPAPSSIGVLGHSRGGGMAILESARNPGIKALVTWAAIGSVDRWSDEAKQAWRRRGFVNIQNTRTGQIIPLRTDILDDIQRNAAQSLDISAAAARIQAPWLIVHGEADESVAIADALYLHQQSSERATLFRLPGAGHTFGAVHPLKEVPPALDQVLARTVGWFSQHLS